MIYTTITEHEFANWIQNSGSYKNNFTWEGANALQNYLEELSDELDQNIEFDPIAWCCEYAEYKNIKEAYKQSYFNEEIEWEEKTTEKMLEYLQNNTEVIEFDGGVIVRDF